MLGKRKIKSLGLVYIPSNTADTQYIARDNCYLFSSRKFDQKLVLKNNITKAQVVGIVNKINSTLNNFCVIQIARSLIFFLVLGFIYFLIHSLMQRNYMIFMIGSIIEGVSGVICCVYLQYQNKVKIYNQVKEILEKENKEKWHNKEIHLSLEPQLAYIAIHFNWNKKTGKLNKKKSKKQVEISIKGKNQENLNLVTDLSTLTEEQIVYKPIYKEDKAKFKYVMPKIPLSKGRVNKQKRKRKIET